MPKAQLVAVGLCLLSGCGYVGDPLPPLLNIPARVTDLAAVQRGSRIIAQFTLPKLTTDGTVIHRPVQAELFVGPLAAGPFDEHFWSLGAKSLGEGTVENGRVLYDMPAAEWSGKQIALGAKVTGSNGRTAGWSNFAVLTVVAAPGRPAGVRAEAVAQGVRLTWQGGGGPAFRVLRRAPGEQSFKIIGNTSQAEWIDNAIEFGKTYAYLVQAVEKAGPGEAESELSDMVEITPEDRFPPATPSNVKAVVSTATIELTWDRNTEADLIGYRVYRAAGEGAFEMVAEVPNVPGYSDRKLVHGTMYRYAITAYDRSGNESPRSVLVQVMAP